MKLTKHEIDRICGVLDILRAYGEVAEARYYQLAHWFESLEEGDQQPDAVIASAPCGAERNPGPRQRPSLTVPTGSGGGDE